MAQLTWMLASKIHVVTSRQCPLLKIATEHRKIAAKVRLSTTYVEYRDRPKPAVHEEDRCCCAASPDRPFVHCSVFSEGDESQINLFAKITAGMISMR
ncbi:hypothetical protein [Celeribacter sp.]|uniref:hypothetical protein n=1 Tax=Celeribacter sp. TaxID=1890673 RepID=UPI003A93DB4E